MIAVSAPRAKQIQMMLTSSYAKDGNPNFLQFAVKHDLMEIKHSSMASVKVSNDLFVCDVCLTKQDNNKASSVKEQIQELATTVTMLAQEFKAKNKVSELNDRS